jgi:hypothetical protein
VSRSLLRPRNFGRDDGPKWVAIRFSFASARVDSGNRAETPQSATKQVRARDPSLAAPFRSTQGSRRCWRGTRAVMNAGLDLGGPVHAALLGYAYTSHAGAVTVFHCDPDEL